MGEFERSPDGLIQADFALHAGTLLTQYGSLTSSQPPKDRYEATLTLCVLQSLLTNCTELLGVMKPKQKQLFHEAITEVHHPWGLMSSLITQTFPGDVTLEKVLTHLRNAVSHPTVREGRHPSTGYTTSNDASGIISAFRFTDSPWVKNGQTLWGKALSRDEDKVRRTLEKFERDYKLNGFLEVRRRPDGKFEIAHDGQQYHPVFVIELPLSAMIDLALHLANYLAQPTNEDWDGQTILQLVA